MENLTQLDLPEIVDRERALEVARVLARLLVESAMRDIEAEDECLPE